MSRSETLDFAQGLSGNPGPNGRMYFIGWAIAATVALVYLATLALRPDLIVAHAIGRPHDLEGNEGDRFLARNSSAITSDVAQAPIEAAIESLKVSLKASEERERSLHARIAALEARVSDAPLSVRTNAGEGAAGQGSPQPSLIEGRVEDVALAQPAKLPPPPPVKPKAALPPAAAAPNVAQALPGTVIANTEPQKSYGIALASGPSLEALRLSWSLLSDRHKAALAQLDARYLIQTDPAAPYQLVAGPFPTSAKAQQVCAVLQARKAVCKVSDFGGNAL